MGKKCWDPLSSYFSQPPDNTLKNQIKIKLDKDGMNLAIAVIAVVSTEDRHRQPGGGIRENMTGKDV